jgi:predicted nucleic acid-binding protein
LNTYIDSSFLVSSYVTDAHSPQADLRLALGYRILITPFNRAEFANAVHQQVFLHRFALVEAQRINAEFQRDCITGIWVLGDFPPRAWETCADLARSYGPTLGVRTLDSLHVACALELKAQRFWTFDDRQAKLAEAVGLDTGE